jgi:hypothetical protein
MHLYLFFSDLKEFIASLGRSFIYISLTIFFLLGLFDILQERTSSAI